MADPTWEAVLAVTPRANGGPLRVVVVTPDFPPAKGGIQRLLGELASRAAWETLVITLGRCESTEWVATHRIAVHPRARRSALALLNIVTLRRGRAWRPDAVVSGHIAVSPGAIALGRLLDVPVVQYVYSKEMTHRPRMARFAVTRAARTIAISGHTARLAIEAGAPRAQVETIEPGVDPPPPSDAPQERSERPTILTVARLHDRYKGFDVLVRALPLVTSRLPDARWVVVGDGDLRPEFEAIVAARGLSDSVVFAGTATDEERNEWFARAHVFAMPSRVPPDGGGEGYGLVFLEAGAYGLPCVAGDAGAVAETVVHGETGLLVDARDHAAVAEALITLLCDPERAAELGSAGRERARARSWDRMTREVEALLESTVATWRTG